MKTKKIILILMFLIFLYGCDENLNDTNLNKSTIINLTESLYSIEEENKSLYNKIIELEENQEQFEKEITKLGSRDIELKGIIDYNDKNDKEIERQIIGINRQMNFSISLSKEIDGYKEVFGYIKEMDIDDNKVYFDTCEFLGLDDIERLKELDLNPDIDLPGGFKIYNEKEQLDIYDLTDNTNYIIYTYYQEYLEKIVSKGQFAVRIPTEMRFYLLKILNGKVIEASEIYIP